MIKASIFLVFFTFSSAYAHPVHMTHEGVQHEAEQVSGSLIHTDKIAHDSLQEKTRHSDMIPCTEQHKELPCKKK